MADIHVLILLALLIPAVIALFASVRGILIGALMLWAIIVIAFLLAPKNSGTDIITFVLWILFGIPLGIVYCSAITFIKAILLRLVRR